MSYNPLLLYFYVSIQLVCYIQQYGFQIIFQLKILVLAHKPCLREVASLSLWIFEDAMKQSCLRMSLILMFTFNHPDIPLFLNIDDAVAQDPIGSPQHYHHSSFLMSDITMDGVLT